MDVFDTIIMLIGGLLIVIGLMLFISGTKESTSHNNVEGFGIKLNVSNPSILLIVFGIGLLLVPRLLPKQEEERPRAALKQAKRDESQPSEPLEQYDIDDSTPNSLDMSSNERRGNSGEISYDNSDIEQTEPITTGEGVQASTLVMLAGRWQLSSYEEDGFTVDGMQGYIDFGAMTSSAVNFTVFIISSDFWGNQVQWQSEGAIRLESYGYSISYHRSTAPNFVPSHGIPLDLKVDPDQRLHMGYVFGATDVLVHWAQ